ncbi:hypothetical protein GGR34_000092 [Microvirga flocculans]|uniref:Uncharacterized protein n=1 Tax=Microvirga flocculans TaxID=217168 RepID=A0A7W6N6M4_9HYPH|nr:hypothetical protein [Microvirga flocculans]MBB4038463.1 hypothetical protein [Microvirga flocculans]
MPDATLSKSDLVRLVGDMPDEVLVSILETGASVEDIEAALQRIASADDVMGKMGRPLSGPAVAVYDILLAEEAADERER